MLVCTLGIVFWVYYFFSLNEIYNNDTLVSLDNENANTTVSTNGCLAKGEEARVKRTDSLKAPQTWTLEVIDTQTQTVKRSFDFLVPIPGHYHPFQLLPCHFYYFVSSDFDFNESKAGQAYKFLISANDYLNRNDIELYVNDLGDFGKKYLSDFRVSYSEKYIAQEYAFSEEPGYGIMIRLLPGGEDYYHIKWSDIRALYPEYAYTIALDEWSSDSNYYWFRLHDWSDIVAFVRVDVANKTWDLYPIPGLADMGYTMNLDTGWLPYDDGPSWTGDAMSEEEDQKAWESEGKKAQFVLYNIYTKQTIFLEAFDEVHYFPMPRWVDMKTLEYTMPDGKVKKYTVP